MKIHCPESVTGGTQTGPGHPFWGIAFYLNTCKTMRHSPKNFNRIWHGSCCLKATHLRVRNSLFSQKEALFGRLAKKGSHALFFRVGPTLPVLLGPAITSYCFSIPILSKAHPGPKHEQQHQKTRHAQQAEQGSGHHHFPERYLTGRERQRRRRGGDRQNKGEIAR